MSSDRFDLVVIGSGPAGQKAAIAASKLGRRVAIVDRRSMLGGVCLHTGTIPSKTLREAVLYLTGFRERAFYGKGYKLRNQIEIAELKLRVDTVVKREHDVVVDQLRRNRVEHLDGMARFVDPHVVEVETEAGAVRAHGEHVLIACGTRPAPGTGVPYGEHVIDSDGLVQLAGGEVPRSAIVVGAGVIGLEYASMIAALGAEVTVIDARDSFLDFVDEELVEALSYQLRAKGVRFRLGENVREISRTPDNRVLASLESGKQVRADALLYAVGRQPNTDSLNLEVTGVGVNERGRVEVDENYRTVVPHIYAAGDVIGFPMLASTSMEQGRIASCHMFGVPYNHSAEQLPYGIYTIPEMAMVGRNERQLTQDKVPYEVGLARFEELTRAQIIGERAGLLKLLFDPESRRLLGVHIIGDGAAELLHIGQVVLMAGGTLDSLRDVVFNYPTLAEGYKVAAINGLNKL